MWIFPSFPSHRPQYYPLESRDSFSNCVVCGDSTSHFLPRCHANNRRKHDRHDENHRAQVDCLPQTGKFQYVDQNCLFAIPAELSCYDVCQSTSVVEQKPLVSLERQRVPAPCSFVTEDTNVQNYHENRHLQVSGVRPTITPISLPTIRPESVPTLSMMTVEFIECQLAMIQVSYLTCFQWWKTSPLLF